MLNNEKFSVADNARSYNNNNNNNNNNDKYKTKKCRGTKKHDCTTLIESKYQLCKECRRENYAYARKKCLKKFIKKNPNYYKKYGKGYVSKTLKDSKNKKPIKQARGGIDKMKELKITPGEIRDKLKELKSLIWL